MLASISTFVSDTSKRVGSSRSDDVSVGLALDWRYTGPGGIGEPPDGRGEGKSICLAVRLDLKDCICDEEQVNGQERISGKES
jgi:hypothetical protein